MDRALQRSQSSTPASVSPPARCSPQPPAPSMLLQDSGVQYSRWDDSSRDEVSVAAVSSTEEASSWESCHPRFSQKLHSSKLGLAMKALVGMAVFWAVFILGYITGYFVH
ncbi:small integral membrane protein 1 isoform 1-T1 [Hipposideros larvatus]